jgi:hypothetical protein
MGGTACNEAPRRARCASSCRTAMRMASLDAGTTAPSAGTLTCGAAKARSRQLPSVDAMGRRVHRVKDFARALRESRPRFLEFASAHRMARWGRIQVYQVSFPCRCPARPNFVANLSETHIPPNIETGNEYSNDDTPASKGVTSSLWIRTT